MAGKPTDPEKQARKVLDQAAAMEPPPATEADYDPARESAQDEADRKAVAEMGEMRARFRPVEKLPEDCPVRTLGMRDGKCFFLDSLNQLRDMDAMKVARLNIVHLFGAQAWQLKELFPRINKDFEVIGVNFDEAAQLLIRECGQRGVFDADKQLRGRGAWRGDDGRLTIHFGDTVLVGVEPKGDAPVGQRGQAKRPGLIDGKVYPGLAPIGRPGDGEPVRRRKADAGSDVLDHLQTWNWHRKIDPILLLGWIAAAILGGALDWRPLIWIVGSAGTGKSTLHELIKTLLNGWLIQTSDTTAAGIWQKLKYDSLPVAIDEIESDDHNDKSQKIVQLARQACSGGEIFRGGNDHQGAGFRVRSAFLFSSILQPPLLAQDRSRMAILSLRPFNYTGPSRPLPTADPDKLAVTGQALMLHLIYQWGRYRQTLKIHQAALKDAGHNARAIDQFGTLLALADLSLNDGIENSRTLAKNWASDLDPAQLIEMDGLDGNEMGCLNHLLGTTIEIARQRRAVGDVLQELHDYWYSGEKGVDGLPVDYGPFIRLNRDLAAHGVRYVIAESNIVPAVAKAHPGLVKIFSGTLWSGRAGAIGPWAQALERLDGAAASTSVMRFSGVRVRAILLPLDMVSAEGGDASSDGNAFRGKDTENAR